MRYEGKLKEINARLWQPSSPLRIAIITGMNLIFLAMVNLFWTVVRVVINISGDKPPKSCHCFHRNLLEFFHT
ncbi:hypothetical protein MSLAZ_1995 [Methanosarcina lacustris Z-7289]|uniref:Uncharacterized protein n=1 Tax=Methanosarcina lacustris Z-7289 TaxID=1434111 RepID=A0A0E3S4S8_9EURY|nr:hypothetical protein [Methanosarcina lacustris]AKB75256.1 hypothetical protein MSLAZ_1995 [Methanosarcina lacustris Z-7289]